MPRIGPNSVEAYSGGDLVIQTMRYVGTQVITSTLTAGTFTLNNGNKIVQGIPWDASAARMKIALQSIFGAGNVAVTGSNPWTTTPTGRLSQFEYVYNNLLSSPDEGVDVQRPPLDISSGYQYFLQGRFKAGSTLPDLQIDASHTSQGIITLGGASGAITSRIYQSAIAGLSAASATANTTKLGFVLREVSGGSPLVIVTGFIDVQPQYYI